MAGASEELSPLKQAIVEIRTLRAEVERLREKQDEAVAVVGIGCRFPGGADSPDAFWRRLTEGFDAIVETPADRWDAAALYDPDDRTPGRIASKWGGFLSDIDKFDARFFGISPREAEAMDPQQRLILEVSWEALEHAGIAPDTLTGSRTGVMVGIGTNDYAALQIKQFPLDRMDVYYTTGAVSHAVSSGRVSYVLGLNGPALSVDTACSSSLMSVHLACQALRQGEADVMLAGGVNVILSPQNSVGLSRAQMMASDGLCKAFDEAADGFVRSEGAGMLVLKRLSAARADGDRVLAMIRGSAANQDGRSAGLTAPNGPSQVQVIRHALSNAGVEPHQVGFIEAHGTGTALGDPIEISALAEALCPPNRSAPLIVGSVKSNMGHLETAAGVAGLIKLILCAHHGQIPANLHFKQPSKHIAWGDSPIEVPVALRPWQPIEGRRIGGVSSFGFSGTNVHVVVEEATTPRVPVGVRPAELYTLSTKSPEELRVLTAAHARAVPALFDDGASLAEVAHTARVGRSQLTERAALVVRTPEQLVERLKKLAAGDPPPSIHLGQAGNTPAGKIGFLFSGQGSQSFGMARELYETEPGFRAMLDHCDGVLRGVLPRPLLATMFDAALEGQPLTEGQYAQPALFAVQVALADLWRRWGIEPRAVHGHSLGEYAAACVAGVFSLEDGLRLTADRGRLIDELPRDGMMAVVFGPADRVRAAIASYETIEVASYNGPDTIVISGRANEVEAILARFAADDVKTRTLEISFASHNRLVMPIVEKVRAAARRVPHDQPRIPLISNVYGRRLRAGEMTPDYWCDQMLQPVRFEEGMHAMGAEGCATFIEVGASPMLSSLGASILAASDQIDRRWLASLRRGQSDWDSLLDTAAELFTIGQPIDLSALGKGFASSKVTLPTYPFVRKRYWLEGLTTATAYESGTTTLATTTVLAATVEDDPQEAAVDHIGLRETLLALLPMDREDRLVRLVREQVAKALKADDPSQIDRHVGLMDLGLDSLMAVELRSGLSNSLELDSPLPATLIMDHPNIDAIVALLGRTLFEEEFVSPITLSPSYEDIDWFQREGEIESMSDEEVEAALLGKLRAFVEEA